MKTLLQTALLAVTLCFTVATSTATECRTSADCATGEVCDEGLCFATDFESKCGQSTCGADEFCCNRSCSICAPMGGACTQQVCEDTTGGSYEPCGAKVCGDSCTICPPGDPNCVETAVVKYCQADGSCSPTTPSCTDGSDTGAYTP